MGTGVGVGVGVGSGVNVGAGVAVGGTGVSNAGGGGARMVARPDGKFRGSTTGGELGSESGSAPNSNAAAMVASTLGVGGTSAFDDGTSVGSAASEPLQLNITVIRTKAMMPVNRCRPIPTVPVLPASPGYVHN